ncbi:BTB/POZ protein, partial [Achaetomium macrosporum]
MATRALPDRTEERDTEQGDSDSVQRQDDGCCRSKLSIFSSLSALFLSDKYSDMTITCGGRELKAHRAIVCSQSRFFDKAFSGGFSEAVTGVIDLPEDDPDVLERFLQFLYTGTYDDGVISAWLAPSEDGSDDQSESEEDPRVQTSAFITFEPQEGERDDDDESFQSDQVVWDTADDEYEHELDDQDSDDDPMELSSYPREEEDKLMEEWRARQSQPDNRHSLLLPLRLYVMADKFDVPPLKQMARERFLAEAEATWRVSDYFP